MTTRWFGSAALLLSLGYAITPTLAGDRHQQVPATAREVASTAPLAVPDPAPAATAVIVTPAAAAAPQSPLVPAYGRNCHQNRTTQALTQ